MIEKLERHLVDVARQTVSKDEHHHAEMLRAVGERKKVHMARVNFERWVWN
jgi:hypothetical protein